MSNDLSAQNLRVFGYSQSLMNNVTTENLDGNLAFGGSEYTTRSFFLQQTNVFLANRFSRKSSAFVNIEFVNNQDVEKGFGNLSLQEAWFDYNVSNDFSLKFGKLLPKFGALNDQRNRTPILPFATRPLIYENLYGEIFNQEDYVPLFAFFQAEKRFELSNKLSLETTAFLSGAEEDLLVSPDNRADESSLTGSNSTDNLTLGGKINFVFSDYNVGIFKLGLSLAYDGALVNGSIVPTEVRQINPAVLAPDLGTAGRMRYVFDLNIQLDRLEILGEYAISKVNYSDDQVAAFDAMNAFTTGIPGANLPAYANMNNSKFYWANITYNFKNDFYLLARYEELTTGNDAFFLNEEGLRLMTFGGGYRYNNLVFKAEFSQINLDNGGLAPSQVESIFNIQAIRLAAGFTF
jgi:hypothetical protein